MSMIFSGFMAVVLVILFELIIVYLLWVLRVAIDWWLNIDYVEEIKKWLKKRS